jgi:hypothetical protein
MSRGGWLRQPRHIDGLTRKGASFSKSRSNHLSSEAAQVRLAYMSFTSTTRGLDECRFLLPDNTERIEDDRGHERLTSTAFANCSLGNGTRKVSPQIVGVPLRQGDRLTNMTI